MVIMAGKPSYEELEQNVEKLHKDIIKQKRIETKLKSSEKILRAFLKSPADISIITDTEGKLLYSNDFFAERFNKSVDELIGLSVWDLMGETSPRIAEKRKAYADEVIRTCKPVRFQDEREGIWFDSVYIPILDERDQVTQVACFARDISELKGSETKYRLLAENVTDVICVVHLDKLKFEYVSPSITSVLGYTVEEFMNFDLYDLLLPHSADLVMETIDQEIEKNNQGKAEPQLLELDIVRKDGLKTCLGVSARFLRDNDERVTSILCIARDVSERKKAGEALKKERDRAQLYLDIAGVMFVAIDTKYNVTMINKKGCDILGYDEHEIVGRNWFDHFIKAEDIESVKGAFDQMISGDIEPVEYYENVVLRNNGDERTIAWHNSVVRDDSGRIVGTLSSGEDITERRQAEQALRKSEKMHRLLAENARDTIFRQTLPDGNFEYISSAFKSLTGYTPEELYNEPFLMTEEIVHPDSADCFKEQWAKLLNGDISPYYEYKVVAKSGEIKWANQRSVLIIDGGTNSPKAIEGIISDVTELKKAEEELLKEKDSLEEKVIRRTNEIQEKNLTLKVLLDQRSGDKKKLEQEIMANVKKLIMPNINRLKSSTLSSKQLSELSVLEANLNEIISPFASTIESKYTSLTPTETQVANFIKHGASSKEISESLCLSQRTVDTHRYNIRKKLGISGQRVNLRTYLLSMA